MSNGVLLVSEILKESIASMPSETPTLHMICGKIAAGKSTLAARLAEAKGTVLISEDVWLEALFLDELSSISDYARCSAKLRQVMGPHVSMLLDNGISVVLDFPANTFKTRKWMKTIVKSTNASHKLHVLDPPDDVCLARLKERNVQGKHPFAVTEEQFFQFSNFYEPPSPSEGFDIQTYNQMD